MRSVRSQLRQSLAGLLVLACLAGPALAQVRIGQTAGLTGAVAASAVTSNSTRTST